jgi:hypothetical protein
MAYLAFCFLQRRLEKFYLIESDYDFFATLRGACWNKKSPTILRFFVKTRFSYSTTLLLRIGTLSSMDPDFVTAERELEPGYQVARSRIQRGPTQAQ